LQRKAGWEQVGRGEADEKMELTFMVKQRNVPELEKELLEVSDPRSPRYGQHLSNEQVHSLVAPARESVEAVRNFLEAHGVHGVSATPNSDMITAEVTLEVAERLLNAEYYRFEHAESGHVAHRTLSYGLPSDVVAHVDFVAPTVRLPAWNHPEVDTNADASNLNTPAVLRKLYSVNDEMGKHPKNRQAVTGFLEQFYSASDLQEFYTLYFKEGKGQTMATKGDAPTGTLAGTEAMLDAEYITSLGGNIPSEFWGFSGRAPDNPQNEPFLKWLQAVSNSTDEEVPLVFSTSYGEDEESITMEFATRINTEFMKAGARGVSLLFASGDSGAAGINHLCKNGQFVPMWPAPSPYVTAVGGTQGGGLAPPETAASISSGGFSNRWPRPAWQEEAVATYLKNSKVPATKFFNTSGRGFPDISAQAMSFMVVMNKIPLPGVSGTSCASPTAAGIFGLLNDARLQAGQPPMGFLNPFIYQNAAAFNDCNNGSNLGCIASGMKGFPAVDGWDAVTGLGTPNFQALKAAALNKQVIV
jgi:tripeptidyl-peptidase-1